MNKSVPLALLLALTCGVSGCSYLPSWAGGSKKEEKPKIEGKRITVLPASSTLEKDASLDKTPFVLPPVTQNKDWMTHGGGFSAAAGNLAGSSFEHSMPADAGEGDKFIHTLVIRPVVADGAVYAMDGAGHVSAHEASDITHVRWVSPGVSEKHIPDIIGGGLAYNQGTLYAVSGRGMVVAMTAATGKEIWRKSLRAPFRSPPEVAGGKLYAVTVDNQVYALNTANGDVVWNHRGISETTGMMNAVSPRATQDTVVVPYSSGEIYVLAAADGKEMWNNALTPGKRTQASALFAGIGGDPLVDGDILFSASSGGMISVQSVANGQSVWDKPIGSLNTPWLAGDYLFMLSTDNTLVAFVKYDGRIRWTAKLKTYEDEEQKKYPITWKGPVMVDGKLALIGSNGTLLLVSAETGKVVSSQSIPKHIYTPPVVAGGKMYLVDQGAVLYALY